MDWRQLASTKMVNNYACFSVSYNSYWWVLDSVMDFNHQLSTFSLNVLCSGLNLAMVIFAKCTEFLHI